MDLSKYPKNTQSIYLTRAQITQMNWEGCPEDIEEIDLGYNQITQMNWGGCPKGLKCIYLHFNEITEMNWNKCPEGFKEIYLSRNKITEMKWKGCPEGVSIYPRFLAISFEEYKKTKEFIERKTKPKRDINAEISANTMLPPNNKIKTYKENFYEMVREMQCIIKN
jgi:hypothetical protein